MTTRIDRRYSWCHYVHPHVSVRKIAIVTVLVAILRICCQLTVTKTFSPRGLFKTASPPSSAVAVENPHILRDAVNSNDFALNLVICATVR
jgi:hypothetical protein